MLIVPDNDILTGHNNDGDGLKSLTIEIEFKTDTIQQCQLVRKTEGSSDLGYQLFMDKRGRIGFYVCSREGKLGKVISRKTIEPGKWHKVTATWDSRYEYYNGQIHIDGYISWGGNLQVSNLTNTDAPLTIGGLYRAEGNYGQYSDGQIKSLAISTNRPELLNISGKCDPEPVKATGEHLLSQPGLLRSEFIYQTPPTPECHSSSIVSLGNNKLAAAWFGGTHEGHTDVAIYFSTFDGQKWSQPRALVRSPQYNQVAHITLFNPVLFKHSSGKLLCFYKEGWLEEMECRLLTSDDDGQTWSKVKYYHPGLHGPSKNKPLELPDGSLICPSGGEKMEITPDLGDTWQTVNIPNPDNLFFVIQPTILTHPDQSLQALFRTRENKIAQSFSRDHGQSWSPLAFSNMPNNNSGLDAVTLQDGRFLLVYNHTTIPEGRWSGPRSPLNVAVSKDGVNWQAALILEDEPGEYSYPAVIQDQNGIVQVSYTWKRLRIKWASIDPQKLILRDLQDGQWPQSF